MAYPILDFAGSGGSLQSLFGSGDISTGNPANFGMGGTNQYMNYPSVSYPGFPMPPGGGAYGGGMASPATTSYNLPGAVPQQGSPFPITPAGKGGVGATDKLPGQTETVPSVDPNFTASWAQYLASQFGLGASPYNLQAFLPSTGGFAGPGQVTAPLTPELQQLAQFLQTGQGGGVGAQTLQSLSETGLPTDVGPAWQAAIAAQQRNIAENANQLREQFAGMGALDSSPFGTAISDFYSQTTKDQNAQLLAAEQAAQEAAAGRRAGASSELFGAGQGLGEFLQGLDQQSINALMQEFIRTSPDYSPLLGMESGFATTYPPIYGKGGFAASIGSSFGSALGQSLGSFGLSNKSGTLTLGGG
jgi:hypothetical protein